jgi:hypothetical protein
MSGVKVLVFALLIVVQAASQDGSNVFSKVALRDWKTNPFASFIVRQPVWRDAFQMFPYPVPEDGPSSPPEQVLCKFSDGKAITVNYSTRNIRAGDGISRFGDTWVTLFDDIIFVTDQSLITVKGMRVPAGDYTILANPNRYPRVFQSLTMKRHKGGELRVPVSLAYLASPAEKSAISFEHTGGSCVMQVSLKNWKQQGSVEFTEKNADLPVAK